MSNININRYIQTAFDQAFISAVEYLTLNKAKLKVPFKFKKHLLQELEIPEANYVEIRKGTRGVPKNKIEAVIRILTRKYDVEESFLRTNKGRILKYDLDANSVVSGHHESLIGQSDIEATLRTEIEYLKKLVDEKQKIIELLDKTLEMYKKQYES